MKYSGFSDLLIFGTLVILIILTGCKNRIQDSASNLLIDSLETTFPQYISDPFQFEISDVRKFESVTDSLINLGYDEANLVNLTSSGYANYLEGRLQDALELFLLALPIAEERERLMYQGLLNQEIAHMHILIDQNIAGYQYEKAAGEAWEILGEELRLAHSLNYQGMQIIPLERYDTALSNFKRSLLIFKNNDDKKSQISTLNQIGRVFNLMNKYDSSMYYLSKGISISNSLNEFWKFKSRFDIANGYFISGDYESALVQLEDCIEPSQSLSVNEKSLLFQLLGKVHYQLNDLRKAEYYLTQSLNGYNSEKINITKSKTLKLIAEIYEQSANYKQALEVTKEAIAIEEANQTMNNSLEMTKLTAKHESEKKDLFIKNQNSQLKNKNLILMGLILGIILLFTIILLIIRISNQRKNSTNKIIEQKEIIQKTLTERESLLKEIHHRVKNNLQIIASLLYLQSGKFEDEDFKKVLEEGQGRVRSMALIHQKLYENEDLKSIPFGEYLQELVGEIRASFGMGNIQLNIEAENIFFDVDTAVPLGLIVNEMATNAFKYAFLKKEKGVLSIFLTEVDGEYILNIKDDGKGIPEEVDIRKTKSLGLRLVRMLSQQLEGEFEFNSKNGTNFQLKFAA